MNKARKNATTAHASGAAMLGSPPAANWPGGAGLALQSVINDEQIAENCVLHGDRASEAFLSEIVGAQPNNGTHDL